MVLSLKGFVLILFNNLVIPDNSNEIYGTRFMVFSKLTTILLTWYYHEYYFDIFRLSFGVMAKRREKTTSSVPLKAFKKEYREPVVTNFSETNKFSAYVPKGKQSFQIEIVKSKLSRKI